LLRRVRGTERDEVAGDWRRLHYEELYDLFPSPCIGERRGAYRVLVGKPEGGDH